MARSTGRSQAGTLKRRLLVWHAVAVVAVLLGLGVVLDRVLEHYFVSQLTDSLVSEARAVQESLPGSGSLQPGVLRLGRAMAVRITVIRTDGVVLADSEHDPATMENHRTRPEIQQALAGHLGVSSRRSATIGISFRYVALPPEEGRIVRVALPLTAVQSRLRSVRVILSVGFALAALAGILVLSIVARGVSGPLRRMADAVGATTGRGGPPTIPEEGTEELVLLSRTINRMSDEVAARIQAVDKARGARDAILSSLEEGIVLFDAEGAVLYANPRAAGLLGGPPREVRSLSPSALREMVFAATDGAPPKQREIVVGPAAWTLRVSAIRIPGDGTVLLVLRDVTQARRLEAVRRDFVANASHELKTPAASIQALAETISSAVADDPEAVARFSDQLEREAIRLSRLISDLLDLSMLEGEPAVRSHLLLDELIVEEAERLRARAERASLTLLVEAGEPVVVKGSPRDLALMVRNLVENAVQYTRPGGLVEVKLDADDREALVMVRDTGIGIPSRDQPRIFERFYRVDRARSRETGGTGLGLSIVKHVAEGHGGTVALESELGAGSTFTVRLPLEDEKEKSNGPE
jgi:two-component system phosphate regulon sensor histidine kinase PhoR